VTISVSKEGVRFSTQGELGDGAITLKSNVSIDDEDDATVITLTQPATLMFSVKYLQNFAKASQLSKTVTLQMTNEVPMLIDYKIEDIGYLRYYIAPKIGDDEIEADAE
jgi:proliferating cell nuclear antigen